jgi:hypothetical protein
MENDTKLLKNKCHVDTNEDGDRFVGLKADSDNVMVYFPMGYHLPNTEQERRRDILHLISVLSEFTSKTDRVLHMKKFEAPQSVDFPINAYMEVINYFLEQNSYYTEKEPIYKTSDRGNTDWARTIRQQKPLLQANNSPVYLKQTVRESSPNNNKLITQIHKYCVYESFHQLGWLFTPYLPPKPDFPVSPADVKRFLIELNDRLAKTNNDRSKRLFSSMIAMLRCIDENTQDRQFYFGTDSFEYVWEKLIDRVFGIRNKEDYFPKATWKVKYGDKKEFTALFPDTIMINNNKIYVLDAKYYRYGQKGIPKYLPEGKSIHKQITYGEYIHTNDKFKDDSGKHPIVYNAFLMPYNAKSNDFGIQGVFENCGEAVGEWKGQNKIYEHVQGILVDINYLMNHYTGNHTKKIMKLAESIENALHENGGCIPTVNETA